MQREIPLKEPITRRRITALEIMQGVVIPPIKRVELMSEDDYEEFTLEWVYGFLASKYNKVRSFAGAGDKGRDIVGYYDDLAIDIFQCKHYDIKIAPNTLYVELGKLCHYTFTNAYPIPKSYNIVAPKGCGPSVLDWIANPKTINKDLIQNWDKYCKGEITKTQKIELIDNFKTYVEDFDFSILRDIAPHELIEQHSQTNYHIVRFGGGIKKYRDFIPLAEPEIQVHELRYTAMLFEVYGEKLTANIADEEVLKATDERLYKHFATQYPPYELHV